MFRLDASIDALVAEQITLTGCVQGVGVRPAIARWAAACEVAGHIKNSCAGVEIFVEGHADAIQRFAEGLGDCLPTAATVESLARQNVEYTGYQAFVIAEGDADGPLAAAIPTDAAVCSQCLREAADPSDRRVGYPFTSCTACGPRYSIIESMPYERQYTTMRAFGMCQRCNCEYTTPADRRFHAQSIACPQCGPRLWCVDGQGSLLGEQHAAMRAAIESLLAGEIVAIGGLGGYQLLCDATSNAAVDHLRLRKGRPHKPLAVMIESLAAGESLGFIDAHARDAICAAANPIVLVPARPGNGLAAGIHPGLNEVGLFLPTTPLHWLLLRGVNRPLVATSGNREGRPLCYRVQDAQSDLCGIADLWLHHDRPIQRPIDDSVVRIIAGKPVSLRLARGLAPLKLPLDSRIPLLAVGGQQKNAIAIHNGVQAILGPHIGDLGNQGNFDRFVEHEQLLRDLLRTRPAAVVHDLHPEYATTHWGLAQALNPMAVQHHHAHVVAGMIEAQWLDRQVLGFAWDGTGFGADGFIWGGETLLTTVAGFQRVAHLRPFRLPGGEMAIRQPWRVAIALVREAMGETVARGFRFANVEPGQVAQIMNLLARDIASPVCTSAGRLFDAVAALVLDISDSPLEGFPAMLLEAACDESDNEVYPLPVQSISPLELDWRPMIAAIMSDRAARVSPGAVAMRFHRALAEAIVQVCQRFNHPVVLAGGVFQNRILTETTARQLQSGGKLVATPGIIPPGDGGLAAGQLAIASAKLLTNLNSPWEPRSCA